MQDCTIYTTNDPYIVSALSTHTLHNYVLTHNHAQAADEPIMHISMYCPTSPPPPGRRWGFDLILLKKICPRVGDLINIRVKIYSSNGGI